MDSHVTDLFPYHVSWFYNKLFIFKESSFMLIDLIFCTPFVGMIFSNAVNEYLFWPIPPWGLSYVNTCMNAFVMDNTVEYSLSQRTQCSWNTGFCFCCICSVVKSMSVVTCNKVCENKYFRNRLWRLSMLAWGLKLMLTYSMKVSCWHLTAQPQLINAMKCALMKNKKSNFFWCLI